CEGGGMKRGEYRKFRIRGQGPGARAVGLKTASRQQPVIPETLAPNPQPLALIPDDFAAMEEVVRRRYRKVLEEGGPFPDLILIDGGKGQLTAPYAALHDLGLANLVTIGSAKKQDWLIP